MRICTNVVDGGLSCGSQGALSTTGFQGASMHNPAANGWYVVDFGSSVSVTGLRAYTHWAQRTPNTITVYNSDSSSGSWSQAFSLQCTSNNVCPSSGNANCEGQTSSAVSSKRYYKVEMGAICTQSNGNHDSIIDLNELSFFGNAASPSYQWTYSSSCPNGFRMLSSESECRTYGVQSVITDGKDCTWGEAASSTTNNYRMVADPGWGGRPTGCWTESRSPAGNSHCLYWSPNDGRTISYSGDQRSICIAVAQA